MRWFSGVLDSGGVYNSYSDVVIGGFNEYVSLSLSIPKLGGFSNYIKGGIVENVYSKTTLYYIDWDTRYGEVYFGGFSFNRLEGILNNAYTIAYVSNLPKIETSFFDGFGFSFVSNPSSTGTEVNNYFYNLDVFSESYAGIGKTLDELKQQSTFTGWDFETVWAINEGETYPYLRENTQSPLPQ